jgi:hypothetical protein
MIVIPLTHLAHRFDKVKGFSPFTNADNGHTNTGNCDGKCNEYHGAGWSSADIYGAGDPD